uniref:Reverse transcriptase domain-containing protein n=1 Tax=Tanacetum cinerariifolium TaxID=118510 RepID=A0A6L2KPW5_TANCI|nr:hypothetical protein [Tanacetum cinerariifolium]
MKSIQTFLEEFNCIPFEEKATFLLQAWFKFFTIKHDQPEDSNELFQKLIEDLKELAEYKESLENSSKEIDASNSNQEQEGPLQDSDIRQLIKEKCCLEVSEEQKQNMKNTILELVEICRQKELICMHDNVDDLIESALNSKLLSINFQRLDNKEQEVKNVVEQPIEHRNCIIQSLQNFRNPNTTLETESDEIIKSGVEVLVPILSENEVTLEDKMMYDVPICENSPICDDHSEIFSDSKNDNDISSDEDDFEDIEYVEASLPDPEFVSVKEENVVQHEDEEEEVDVEDVFQIQDIVLREKLLSINHFIANIESLNDNPTPDWVLNSSVSFPISEESDKSLSDNFCPNSKLFAIIQKRREVERLINVVKNDIPDDSSNDPLLEEANLFLASNNSIPPGIENFSNDSEGDIRFLKELLIDDSIPFPNNESPDFNFEDNLSFPRPPPEPPDADFEPDVKNEISVVMNKFECLRDKFDDDDYYSFLFVIYPEMFPLLLFAESEDAIFDPGISV